ncbi:formate dehydrogenase subunit alpha [Heyndrickxia vini]|uniref:Formate dehydrogenase subunit alpha n=1 Tax=Heyndrickxia vini TaxID=1476025 RepID=A0ABX7E1S6_9BACI|nr:formate dehydrogenase subunit alpha [Heyndrickxia vini]QQZ08302.1 formate dehydrogenase subunit alpha [Heyndrickxia vini]
MGGKVQVIINGKQHEVEGGTRILDYLLEQEVDHPHICYSEVLGPIQTCDTCMCEVDGKILRACSTEFEEGMNILTSSNRAKNAQTEAMDRILENHLLYCTVCDNNNGNCRVHNTAEQLEIEHQTRPFRKKGYEVDMSHPFYRYDPDQCILCGRCVEVCQDLQVNETLSIDWDREIPRVVWDDGKSINESSCVSCGQCATVCPCNALMEKSMLGEAGLMTAIPNDLLNPMVDLIKEVEPDYKTIFALSEVEAAARDKRTKKTKTVCTFCGVGCSFEVWTKGRKILKVEPTENSPVNSVSTCVKGKFGWDFINSEQRLTTPLIRKGEAFVPATWDEAFTLISEKMGSIKETYGGDALGFVSSSKTTNEEAYLMQKLARQVFGTNNVDNCSRYCQSPASDGLLVTVGYGGDSGTIRDIENAGLVITVGANPTEGHPVLATRVKRAKKLRGQKLIVSDLRKHELAERSDLFLHPKQGTDFVWITAVAKYMIDQGWHNEDFIKARVSNFKEYMSVLKKYTLDYAVEVTGLPKEQLIKTAQMIHEADGTCILWGMGVTQNIAGSHTSGAIANLLLVSGNFGRNGAGAFPLRGHNNVQGSCDMGTLPQWLAGNQRLTDDTARANFEKAYGVKISEKPGFTNIDMLEAVEEGKLKAMYLMGEDMAWVDSNANHVHETLSKLEFFVVQDVFLTKTAQFADVVLPAAPSLEKDGTFTNTERRIQRLYQVLDPLGESKPDWWIIGQIAKYMGYDWNYKHPSEIMDEIADLCPTFAGVSYERLEGWNSLIWPVQKDGTDEPLLYTERFNFPDGKARFSLTEYVPPVEFTQDFDLTLNNGRLLEQFHVGNMTNKSQGLQYKLPEVFVEVSPELALERKVEDGSLVRLVSPYGAIKLRAVVTDRVQGKELYVPMHSVSHENAVNLLTGSVGDVRTQTPAYKETKVKMELIQAKGKRPLPMYNPRYATRNPQLGVQVERKWAREDYEAIADVNIPGGYK